VRVPEAGEVAVGHCEFAQTLDDSGKLREYEVQRISKEDQVCVVGDIASQISAANPLSAATTNHLP
jgi:hypothetical protein